MTVKSIFQMLDRTADGAFIINKYQSIVYWNLAAQNILGYPASEVIGQPCYAVLCGCDEQGCTVCRRHCQVSSHALAHRAIQNYDLAVRTSLNELRWVNISILTFQINPTVDPLVIHLFRDATQIKQNEQFIQQLFTTIETGQPSPTPATLPPDIEPLTDREQEVLNLLGQGLSTTEIARLLSVSISTARNHIQNILHKLHVHSRLEAVVFAVTHGLLRKEQ